MTVSCRSLSLGVLYFRWRATMKGATALKKSYVSELLILRTPLRRLLNYYGVSIIQISFRGLPLPLSILLRTSPLRFLPQFHVILSRSLPCLMHQNPLKTSCPTRLPQPAAVDRHPIFLKSSLTSYYINKLHVGA